MRHPWWLAAVLAGLAGGCVSPCSDGACNTGQSLYEPPAIRYQATEQIQTCPPTTNGVCSPPTYLSFAKYWPWLDEKVTTMTAKKCAGRALLSQQWRMMKLLPKDYKRGFVQAFIDVGNGGDGAVPPIPPARYWNAPYRTARGQKVIQWWFDGYRAGAAMAAVELQPLRRITASYDWSVGVPNEPFAATSGLGMSGCPTGNCMPPGVQQPYPPMSPGVRPIPPGFGGGQVLPTPHRPPMQAAPQPAPQPYPPAQLPIEPLPQPKPGYSPFGSLPSEFAPPQQFGVTTPPASQSPPPVQSGLSGAGRPNSVGPGYSSGNRPGYSNPTPGSQPPTSSSSSRSGASSQPGSGVLNDPPVWSVKPPSSRSDEANAIPSKRRF